MNNINSILTRTISSVVSKALQQAVENLKNIDKQIEAKIKNEIFSEYVSIVRSVFGSVFDNYYGTAYDYDALMQSITFIQGKELIPTFVCSLDKFKFSNQLEKEYKRTFNINASNENQHYRDPDLITEEFLGDNFNLNAIDNYEDDVADEAAEIQLDEGDYTRKNNNNSPYGLTRLDTVYNTAKIRAIQTFDNYYKNTIKSKIYKKYNIQL